jgi:glutamate formiminotransferase/formiminotetrahydrofolate cyclodeaminase
MDQIIECVPNVSEGRNLSVIEQLAASIENTSGVKLLHTDVGETANRTVFTFAGEPKNVTDAAFNLIRSAKDLIDMSKHTGTHPRIGAVDVCPLIPVMGISMEETKKYAEDLAARTGLLLNLSVYLYENSSHFAERKKLENIRRGEYEGLSDKIKQPEWKPDYGPVDFNPQFGAIIIGARNFLIAYNVNLSTDKVEIAKLIAGEVRESGYIRATINDGNETKERMPGLLKAVKAIGWYDERYHCAQVSTNITDYRISSIETVFKIIGHVAKKYNIETIGSEIIGMVPLNSIIIDENSKKIGDVDKKIKNKLKKFEKSIKLKFWNENNLIDKVIEFQLLKNT